MRTERLGRAPADIHQLTSYHATTAVPTIHLRWGFDLLVARGVPGCAAKSSFAVARSLARTNRSVSGHGALSSCSSLMRSLAFSKESRRRLTCARLRGAGARCETHARIGTPSFQTRAYYHLIACACARQSNIFMGLPPSG